MRINLNYFYMCKMALDLQEKKSILFDEGDWFFSLDKFSNMRGFCDCELSSSCKCFDLPVNNRIKIWIPTQENIQNILLEKRNLDSRTLLAMFCDTILDTANYCTLREYWSSFTTIEEVWLAFYYFDIGKLWKFKTMEWDKR